MQRRRVTVTLSRFSGRNTDKDAGTSEERSAGGGGASKGSLGAAALPPVLPILQTLPAPDTPQLPAATSRLAKYDEHNLRLCYLTRQQLEQLAPLEATLCEASAALPAIEQPSLLHGAFVLVRADAAVGHRSLKRIVGTEVAPSGELRLRLQGVAHRVSASEVAEENPFEGSQPSAEGAAALSELNQAVEENRMQRLKRREFAAVCVRLCAGWTWLERLEEFKQACQGDLGNVAAALEDAAAVSHMIQFVHSQPWVVEEELAPLGPQQAQQHAQLAQQQPMQPYMQQMPPYAQQQQPLGAAAHPSLHGYPASAVQPAAVLPAPAAAAYAPLPPEGLLLPGISSVGGAGGAGDAGNLRDLGDLPPWIPPEKALPPLPPGPPPPPPLCPPPPLPAASSGNAGGSFGVPP